MFNFKTLGDIFQWQRQQKPVEPQPEVKPEPTPEPAPVKQTRKPRKPKEIK
jgi:hypothetical protein